MLSHWLHVYYRVVISVDSHVSLIIVGRAGKNGNIERIITSLMWHDGFLKSFDHVHIFCGIWCCLCCAGDFTKFLLLVVYIFACSHLLVVICLQFASKVVFLLKRRLILRLHSPRFFLRSEKITRRRAHWIGRLSALHQLLIFWVQLPSFRRLIVSNSLGWSNVKIYGNHLINILIPECAMFLLRIRTTLDLHSARSLILPVHQDSLGLWSDPSSIQHLKCTEILAHGDWSQV